MAAPDELNDRQRDLLSQVEQGGVTEELPDTEEQLLRLAELGHLEADHDQDGWHFQRASEDEPEAQDEPEPQDG